MDAKTALFPCLCFAQCFGVSDKSCDFVELLAEVGQADMGVVLGDVLIRMAHHALDGQLIGAGLVQAAGEGMAAPMGRGSDGADLLHKGSKADAAYFSHLTDEMIKKEREEILKATKEDIRALAPVIREILSTGSFCVIGNAEKIRENQELFGEVKNLFN